jgi:hypothetical protein
MVGCVSLGSLASLMSVETRHGSGYALKSAWTLCTAPLVQGSRTPRRKLSSSRHPIHERSGKFLRISRMTCRAAPPCSGPQTERTQKCRVVVGGGFRHGVCVVSRFPGRVFLAESSCFSSRGAHHQWRTSASGRHRSELPSMALGLSHTACETFKLFSLTYLLRCAGSCTCNGSSMGRFEEHVQRLTGEEFESRTGCRIR